MTTSHHAYETLSIVREGTADWVTLDRPDRLNALDPAMIAELHDYFGALQGDLTTRVVVLRGAGRGFCAGLDIKEHLAGATRPPAPGEPNLPDVIRRMRSCPQPIVALVHGPACGGGFAFVLASDVRIAGESARMNDAFIKLGLSGCELGLSYFLPRAVGSSVAAELMMTGRFLDASRALQTGLVSQVVPDEHLEAAGRKLVSDMLKTTPAGLRTTKETLRRCARLDDLDAVIELEQHAQATCMNGPDFEEALRAFVEKREPSFARSEGRS